MSVTRFIKLNQALANLTVPVLVNSAEIQYISLSNKGRDVHIRMNDKTFFFVKESLAEIEKLLSVAK